MNVDGYDCELLAVQRNLETGELRGGIDALGVEGLGWIAVFDIELRDRGRRSDRCFQLASCCCFFDIDCRDALRAANTNSHGRCMECGFGICGDGR